MIALIIPSFWQDMQEMKNCYDSLLSAAAATANSAYGKHFTAIYEKLAFLSSCTTLYALS